MKFVHLEKGWKDEGILFSSLFLKKKEKKNHLKNRWGLFHEESLSNGDLF